VRADPVGYAQTTDQYRAKYAAYRSDPSLRRMHSRFPLISIWDDHEVVDNYAGGARPTGGLPPERLYTQARRAAAYRAFFESMPTFGARGGSNRIYRALRFGRTVDLILLDQRQYRADQPCGDAWISPSCAELERPRTFLGRRQMGFVKKRLDLSSAAWKILANQVMVMPRSSLGARTSASTRGRATRRSDASCSSTCGARRSTTWSS
jgi:alkaline phosphatase D